MSEKNCRNRQLARRYTPQKKKKNRRKILRPINCDRQITPKVILKFGGTSIDKRGARTLGCKACKSHLQKLVILPHKQPTGLLFKARVENGKLDLESMIRMNTDVLLGHIGFEVSQRRRDIIRPTLHKDHATLCASHVPITTLLFGDKLKRSLITFVPQTRSAARQAHPNSLIGGPTLNCIQRLVINTGSLFWQPVVQEIDPISMSLVKTQPAKERTGNSQ